MSGDANKLVCISNYYIWQIKMKAILMRENVQDLIENHIQPPNFLALVLETQHTEQTMKKAKNLALSGIHLSICDSLLRFVALFNDPSLVQEGLCQKFAFSNQSQILILSSQVYILKIDNGSIKKYVNKTTNFEVEDVYRRNGNKQIDILIHTKWLAKKL